MKKIIAIAVFVVTGLGTARAGEAALNSLIGEGSKVVEDTGAAIPAVSIPAAHEHQEILAQAEGGGILPPTPEPQVEGRVYRDCRYYSNTIAELKVQYRGSLEPGARVFLKYGEIGYRTGSEGGFAWEHTKEVPMPPVARGIRQADIQVELHSRGSNRVVNKLGFVIHIVFPYGEGYDNGHTSAWGSYEVPLNVDAAECSAGDYELLPISVHDK